MEYKKIIEQTDRYDIMQWEFQGMPITFRLWKDGSGIIEIKVDEYFAKANGYKSVSDMAEKTIGQVKFNEMFGGVPEWIRASPNGIIHLNVLFINSLNNPKEPQRDKYRKTCEDARYPILDTKGISYLLTPFYRYLFYLYHNSIVEAFQPFNFWGCIKVVRHDYGKGFNC